jgi:large subunit ribosomal protein L30
LKVDMSPKKEETKKDPVASLEELEKAAAAVAPAPAAAPKARPAPASAPVRVRLVRSGICAPRDQKATLFGLGLRRLNQEVVRSDTPSLRGMLHKVRHLVEVSAAK